MKIKSIFPYLLITFFLLSISSCDDNESYSNLLKKEEKATNWFLSNHKVSLEIPEDGKFIQGKDAPFYRIDNDGYVYMQVINPGFETSRPKKGDLVYFRFQRSNIKSMYESGTESTGGNSNNMEMSASSFVYEDYSLEGTIQYGKGIQTALSYLGYNSEVNLVLKSYYGFTSDQSQCIPYLINIRYFKAEY